MKQTAYLRCNIISHKTIKYSCIIYLDFDTQLTALFFLYTTPQHNLPTNHMAQEVRISILVTLVTSCVKHSCKIPLQSTNAINYFLKYYLYQIQSCVMMYDPQARRYHNIYTISQHQTVTCVYQIPNIACLPLCKLALLQL